MSGREISRLKIIEQIKSKQISQIAGAAQLKMSTRHLRRLMGKYKQHGTAELISKRYGKPSHRRIADSIKEQALSLLKIHYPDFGPTFAHEKLIEVHGFTFSVETLRQWMIAEELWKGKKRRQAHIHPQRQRRAQRGELVQIDGSPHDWFEGRRDKCCLLVFIDDASSELLSLHFVEQECLQGYFDAVEKHLRQHGIPLAYYSDKHGIFRVNIKEAKSGTGKTQLGRALDELGIELICANTPQAKGRVEKANQTLQDRLVKELRLHQISDINTANAFLPDFIQDYNRRFAVDPQNPQDAHRPLTNDAESLTLILSLKESRKVSKNLQLQYHNKVYQIQSKTLSYTLRGATVTVCDNQGDIKLLHKGKMLPYKVFDLGNQPTLIQDSKQVQHPQNTPNSPQKRTYKSPADHPWKKGYANRQVA